MALLQYLQHKDYLLDPKGSLSSAIPAQAIARADQEAQAAKKGIQVSLRERGKRGAYNRYRPRDRDDIGRYTQQPLPRCRDTRESCEHRDPFIFLTYVNKFSC